MKKQLRKVLTIAATTMMALSMPSVATAQSSNIVMIGDSIFSNPTYEQIDSLKPLLGVKDDYAVGGLRSPQGCAQGKINVAEEMKKHTVKPIVNYSCSGARATSNTKKADISEQVDHAVRNGAINKGTSNVLIQAGFNDFTDATNSLFRQQTIDNYKKSMGANIAKIKKAAPSARITMVGYPAISAPNGAACPIRTDLDFNNAGFNFDAFGFFANTERTVNNVMWQTAQKNGVEYYDLRKDSKYNNICAPNSMRWVAGVYEYSKPHNMNNHLTHDGVRGIAKILAQKTV